MLKGGAVGIVVLKRDLVEGCVSEGCGVQRSLRLTTKARRAPPLHPASVHPPAYLPTLGMIFGLMELANSQSLTPSFSSSVKALSKGSPNTASIHVWISSISWDMPWSFASKFART